ncbi:hypothetical protein NL676_026518 [Syzygium grande]|nr:hypothetical protein NL676_026518 [Syzygium grande]
MPSAMGVNDCGRPYKRLKRRVTADLSDFLSFGCSGGGGGEEVGGGPFRTRVAEFLGGRARATLPPSPFSSLAAWRVLFRVGDLDSSKVVVPLDVVEEDVTRSRSVYCDQCRVVGWSGHPVCRKRYHFIIRRSNETSLSQGKCRKSCSRCGNTYLLSDSRCKWCDCVITSEDVEEWVYSQLESNTHLLHGVIHSNGFGHLLSLNGREGGSAVLSGRDIMNFWDGLCTTLYVRKVSVMDVSKKYGMECRLLHSIAHGHSWYGNWGYEFSAGSYALTLDAYKRAIGSLSSMPLSPLLFHSRKPQTSLQRVIAFYLAIAETELLTLQDLFAFMSGLIREQGGVSKESAKKKPRTSKVLCAWSLEEVERVEQAMVRVLLAAVGEAGWVKRPALKGALYKSASPELLDYCLKHLGGKSTANGMVVQTRCNSTASAVEFRLETPSIGYDGSRFQLSHPSREHVIRDLKFLYSSLIFPETMVNYRPQATRERVRDSAAKLLDCKQFMKDYSCYEKTVKSPLNIHLWCHVELSDHSKDELHLPRELIVLPLNATVADLKAEVTKTFQDVYAMFKWFQAVGFPEYGLIEDSLSVKLLTGLNGSVRVHGKCLSMHGLNRFRMERGIENWTVDCVCGAKDDDGERMLACDTCGVWQHTRCAGIDNSDSVPSKYVCTTCLDSSIQAKKASGYGGNTTNMDFSISGATCRVQAMLTDDHKVGSNVNMSYGVP